MTSVVRALAFAAICGVSLPALAQEEPKLVLAIHGSATNSFFQAVRLGFEDACAKVGADCQMLFAQTDGSIPEHVANLETAISRAPDALITTIIDDRAYDEVLARARESGITVIATNVDDTEGARGNARQAFVGQDFVAAGYELARDLSRHFPAEGPLTVLIGVSLPGANFAEKRAAGIEKFLADYQAANPDRAMTVRRIDSGIDPAVTAERVGSALTADPGLTAYFDIVNNNSAVARILRDRGIGAGQVLLAGFDLVPQVVQELQSGYIQVQVDQQPYMQGFLPVAMAYLAHTAGLSPADVNTGNALVYPQDAEALLALSREGLR
ncbi:substrate-binding domain-containing protein [Tropicimonas sp.]|uniref:substrate-binding domain-containing protein n=1 Tax=Tropicimonas sp. TaxID=2067044 RepID=UPI003A8BD579